MKIENNPLIEAAETADLATLRHLLQTGHPVNSPALDGETALTIASYAGYTAIVKELLASGANRETHGTRWGATPLILACQAGHRGIVALLATLAELDTVDQFEEATALIHAVDRTFFPNKKNETIFAIVQILLSSGADRTITDKNGRSPLSFAQETNHIPLITLLSSTNF